LGQRLAACGDLYRNAEGDGLKVIMPNGKLRVIAKGADLAHVIVDRVPVQVVRDGKVKADMVRAVHLSTMLQAERS